MLIKGNKDSLSLKTKLTLAFSAIAVLLLISSAISIFEYRRMSNYVTDLMAGNIHSINVAQSLALSCDEYNLRILAEIGDADEMSKVSFDIRKRIDYCDSLRSDLEAERATIPYVDSVLYSYSAYMLTTLELPRVMESHFIDSRDWYFERLQPRYSKFRSDIEHLDKLIYADLQSNSSEFEAGFQRSMIPGAVSVGACLVLVVLLLFYIITYYVKPIYRMTDAVNAYAKDRISKYNVEFDGDDQLSSLNSGIRDIVDDNNELKRRLKAGKYENDEE